MECLRRLLRRQPAQLRNEDVRLIDHEDVDTILLQTIETVSMRLDSSGDMYKQIIEEMHKNRSTGARYGSIIEFLRSASKDTDTGTKCMITNIL